VTPFFTQETRRVCLGKAEGKHHNQDRSRRDTAIFFDTDKYHDDVPTGLPFYVAAPRGGGVPPLGDDVAPPGPGRLHRVKRDAQRHLRGVPERFQHPDARLVLHEGRLRSRVSGLDRSSPSRYVTSAVVELSSK